MGDIRARLQAQGCTIEDDKALRAGIARECKVMERFAMIRKELLAERHLTEGALAQISEADEEVVRLHREGVERMLQDALGGLSPILPGVEIPSELTEERLIGIHQDMLQLKLA